MPENDIRLESTFEYREYKCRVKRNRFYKLCGYVELPDGHPLDSIDYDQLQSIPVHEGLTFSDKVDGIWTLGFDCAHGGDGLEPEYAKKLSHRLGRGMIRSGSRSVSNTMMQMIDDIVSRETSGKVWTVPMVEDECRKVVDGICSMMTTAFIMQLLSPLHGHSTSEPDELVGIGGEHVRALMLAFPGNESHELLLALEGEVGPLGMLPGFPIGDDMPRWVPSMSQETAERLVATSKMVVEAWGEHGVGPGRLRFDIAGGCSPAVIWDMARGFGLDSEMNAMSEGVLFEDIYAR